MDKPNNLNILKKLHTIMSNVERIEKDAKNNHQNYQYASEKIIKEVLHKQLVDAKVLFYLETFNLHEENGKTVLDTRYHFVDVETGEEVMGLFTGTGQGRDEKGNYAAVTGAIKYILTSTFLIPTGDDPEHDRNEQTVAQGKPTVQRDRDIEDSVNEDTQYTQQQPVAKHVACEICGAPATERKGTTKGGKQYHGVFCSTEDRSHTRWLWN